jgi:hypothetical protein
MFELFIWCFAIYVIYKALRLFLRFFIPEVKRKDDHGKNTQTESKYKDAEEVDFIEIKSDKKNGKDQE